MVDIQREQYKQLKRIRRMLINELNVYPIQELGGGNHCLAFQDLNSNKILLFGYLPNLDGYYIDEDLILPFKRSDGKKAEYKYYKMPTPQNLTYKFYEVNNDKNFILNILRKKEIL